MGRDFCQNRDACQAKGEGHCRPCSALRISLTPEFAARRKAGCKAAAAKPENRERLLKQCAALNEAARNDPDIAAKRREQGYRQVPILNSPEVRALSEPKRLAGLRRYFAERMAWLPDEYRQRYSNWRDMYGAKRAKRMVLAEIARRAPPKPVVQAPIRSAILEVQSGQARPSAPGIMPPPPGYEAFKRKLPPVRFIDEVAL